MLAVRLNRKRLVIVLEDQIYLYDIQTIKLLYTIETSPNPNGKSELSTSEFKEPFLYPDIQQQYVLCPLHRKTATLPILYRREHLHRLLLRLPTLLQEPRMYHPQVVRCSSSTR